MSDRKVIQGDCTQEMREMEESSVDAVVTDPPYGLAFMGKDWDDFEPKEFQEFCHEWGEQALRVLKPGGHLLAFCGTRTYHRMVVGLEDAGFEIRDQIAWMYGSGFPKGQNIGKEIKKAIDNIELWAKGNSKIANAVETQYPNQKTTVGHAIENENIAVENVQLKAKARKSLSNAVIVERKNEDRRPTSTKKITIVVESAGQSIEQSQKSATPAEKNLEDLNPNLSIPEPGKNTAVLIVRPNANTNLWKKIASQTKGEGILKIGSGNRKSSKKTDMSAKCAELIEIWKPIISNQLKTILNFDTMFQTESVSATNVIITESTTAHLITNTVNILKEQKSRTKGVNTSLKPGHEPVVVAQKPKQGTYAENVLEHGVGGLNIDGCRISTDENTSRPLGTDENSNAFGKLDYNKGKVTGNHEEGRWPANVVLDEGAAQLLDQQSGDVGGRWGKSSDTDTSKNSMFNAGQKGNVEDFIGDSGGASRFFYSAKARKTERNAGLNGTDNDIATLKPINLMRWLTRLVTPEDGTVLDPFAGSGTTGCAAEVEGFNYTLIEKRERFAEKIIPLRCDYWSQPENWDELKDHEEIPSTKQKRNGSLNDFAETCS